MNITYLISGIIGAVGFVVCTAIGTFHLCTKDYSPAILCIFLGLTDLALAFYWIARWMP